MQTGAIVRRGNWWYLRFYEKSFVDGKSVNRQVARKLVRVSDTHPTAAHVRAAGLDTKILAPINFNTAPPEAAQPLAEYLELVYLPHIAEKKKASTLKGYTDRFKLVKPYLGDLTIQGTKPPDVERILNAVADSKPRVQSTLNHIKAFLSGAFRFALRHGLITVNPVHDTVVPEGCDSDETYAYSNSEIRAMLKVVTDPAARCAITLAGFTGLRVGELAGLKWSDIKTDGIHVSRAVWRGKIGSVKTHASKGSVPIHSTVKSALDEQRRRSTGEYVFSGRVSGKPMYMENLKDRAIRPALLAAGISWHGWHAFRRGCATNLHELGVPDLDIKEILRHSRVSVTQACYIKDRWAAKNAALERLEKSFKKL